MPVTPFFLVMKGNVSAVQPSSPVCHLSCVDVYAVSIHVVCMHCIHMCAAYSVTSGSGLILSFSRL